MSHAATDFVPLNIAVLTVSDTRNEETDTSGRSLVDNLQSAGHHLVEKQIVIDDKYDIPASAAVATVRASLGNILFPSEGNTTVAPVSGGNIKIRLI